MLQQCYGDMPFPTETQPRYSTWRGGTRQRAPQPPCTDAHINCPERLGLALESESANQDHLADSTAGICEPVPGQLTRCANSKRRPGSQPLTITVHILATPGRLP